MFNDNISKRGQAAIIAIGGATVAGFFTQFGGDIFHTIKNTTVNFSIHIQQPLISLIHTGWCRSCKRWFSNL
jgi:hypothetical protein